ncbi:hypothetical protein GOP47_0026335 [Adiantum capillus-veneris]|nr:hypothetical protein GOP47_0026335 [Adiantum capillus-veneris]
MSVEVFYCRLSDLCITRDPFALKVLCTTPGDCEVDCCLSPSQLAELDDDKVAPIYRLDEICEMLRTSSSDMVREVVEYTMKRLNSRSARVKQKTLRMIKYAVVKGGPEFKRQMQRQAAAVRQLFEYKGQPDVLRGDALNKAVRDTAHEAITVIFASDDKPPQAEEINKRIMGFGSTNYDMHAVADMKKPSLTNVVNDVLEFGSASIKQGLTIISGYSGANIGSMRNDMGSYRGPGLTKSLTSERGSINRFDHDDRADSRLSGESFGSNSGPAGHNSHVSAQDSTSSRADTDTGRGRSSLEERLLDTITAPGGMRLQPTRESLQKFLESVVKLDRSNLCYAIEGKLQSPAWQVRFKTLCILEAIVRQRDEEFFGVVADYFEEDATLIHDCFQLPQTTLKDKAAKILNQLGASSNNSSQTTSEAVTGPEDGSRPTAVYDMPDLIDAGGFDSSASETTVSQALTAGDVAGDGTSNASIAAGNLLGEVLWADAEGSTEKISEDAFAGVSFYTPDRGDDSNDGLFSGLSLNKPSSEDVLLNGFHEDKEATANVKQPVSSDNLVDLLGGATSKDSQTEASLVGLSQNGGSFLQSTAVQMPQHGNANPYQMLGNLSNPQIVQMTSPFLSPQIAPSNSSVLQPVGMFPTYHAPMFVHPNFGSQLAGNAFPQHQQFSGGMVRPQGFNMGTIGMNGGTLQGLGGSGRIPGNDFDFSGNASLHYTAVAESDKKENSKAFDFISDHVLAARTPKKS